MMVRYKKIFFLFVCLFATGIVSATPLTKIKIELKWFHQFQFAGIYAAKEKGFYEAEGLDVEIVERDIKSTPLQDVLANKVQFGVSDSTLILNRLQGKPVVVLAAIYQHSPLVLISLADKKILSPLELRNKRVMYQIGVDEAIIVSMFNELGMTIKDFVPVQHTFKPDVLLTDGADAMSAYLGNQTYYYQQKGLPIRILNPTNYGIDLYGDMLFTSEAFFKNNQAEALAFRKATIKGWRYALSHTEEVVDLILNKYTKRKTRDALLHEAGYTKRMMANGLIEVGHINKSRFSRIEQIYKNWHPQLKQNSLRGLSYKEYLTYDRQWVYQVGMYLVGISIFIVLSSFILVWRSRHNRLKADLAKQKAMYKLDSYKDFILEELITTRTTKDCRISSASEGFLSALGYSASHILGRKKYELYAMDEAASKAYSTLLREKIDKNGIWRGELALQTAMGSVRYFDCVMDEIYDAEGNFQSYLTLHFDVTDKKLAEKRSITDELTGIYNRHKLNEELLHNIQNVTGTDNTFAAILLDADHFKTVNDVFGHNQGDDVLKAISCLIKSSVRAVDIVGRWGGEEFLVICPGANKQGALTVAEKIRRGVEAHQFDKVDLNVTISVGVTIFSKVDSAHDLIERVDKALYQAKRNGRNQVVFL